MKHALAVFALLLLPAAPATGQTLVHSHTAPFHPDDVVVAMFADGSVKSAIEQGQDAARATGSIGVALASARYDLTVLMSVASSDAPVRSNFGAALLPPAVGSGAGISSALIDLRLPDAFSQALGYQERSRLLHWLTHADLHLYASLSSSRWATADSVLRRIAGDSLGFAAADTVLRAATVGLGALLYKDFIFQRVGENHISVGAEAGVAMRAVFGDVANEEMLAFKRATIGTPTERFVGFETGIYLQVENVKAGATYYFFESDVRGMSDGQVVVAISIQGNMFTSTVKRTRSRRGNRADWPPAPPPAAPPAPAPA